MSTINPPKGLGPVPTPTHNSTPGVRLTAGSKFYTYTGVCPECKALVAVSRSSPDRGKHWTDCPFCAEGIVVVDLGVPKTRIEPADTTLIPTPDTIPYPGPNYLDISTVKLEWQQVTRLDGSINLVGAYKLFCNLLGVHYSDRCEFSLKAVDGNNLRTSKAARTVIQLAFRMCKHEEITS